MDSPGEIYGHERLAVEADPRGEREGFSEWKRLHLVPCGVPVANEPIATRGDQMSAGAEADAKNSVLQFAVGLGRARRRMGVRLRNRGPAVFRVPPDEQS